MNDYIENAKRLLVHYFKVVDTENKLDCDCYNEIEGIIDDLVHGIKEELKEN
ncbi:hypothetical protein KQI42_09850 [Tissierella sp. MSJ-40]|uniref:Uncharacterized protein n=1 Tax=Tissierella simiarum TaxID=2841534 RepID=A0ABS6E5X3_9FIRM|nr:hypothetical protein [Tissierella simiarum]MBU5438313.1 hypothetical protein [Tissierella simiarum]